MYKQVNKDSFITSISQYDSTYQKFYMNHVPTYKEYYVESSDDALFYTYFLSKLYNNNSIKFFGCNGKKEVLREFNNYKGNKAGFIVDLDYKPLDNKYKKDVIITTGYSMENFYFFKCDTQYNFEIIFKSYYPNLSLCNKKINEFYKIINDYKNLNLLYYAFFKTCIQFSNSYMLYSNHLNIKDNFTNSDELIDLINYEISHLNTYIQPKFKDKFKENVQLIQSSGFMLIRGHDVFNLLFEFLKKDFEKLKIIDLFQKADMLMIPNDFYNQLILKGQ